jgi:hypothetical protein
MIKLIKDKRERGSLVFTVNPTIFSTAHCAIKACKGKEKTYHLA